ncbi:MAG TPA: SDR family NAD(P)-dependent oxidoreductase, partial [Beijerinckiaceae bacterium]|nr:SDR family NAD(P)-dependent oxidoreductase [Beijerinckiaceae bacterium]
MSRLSNKIAIVTGAGSGFGAAIARAYIKENAKVILADVNLEAARGIAAE